jgi:hypothetical protein
MRKLLLLIGLSFCGALSLHGQTVQCQSPAGAWGPCPFVTPVTVAKVAGTAQVNNKVSGAAGTTITNAFPGNITVGNTLLCVGFEGVITGSVAPVFTDALANTWTVIASGAAAAPGYAVSIANITTGGTTDVITETVVSGSAAFTCYELNGAVGVGQVWDFSAALQATSATLAFGQQSAAIPNEFAVVAVGMGAGTVNATPTIAGVPSTLTTVDQSNTAPLGTAALSVFYSAHASVTNVPTFTQSISLSASETYSAIMVSVKPISINLVGNVQDACAQGTGSSGNINLTASGQLVTGVAGKQTYFCGLILFTATAQNIALVEGTGTTCATGTLGMSGGTTAATGWNLAANGGFVNGGGGYWVFKTSTAGDNVCLLLSGTGQTSGSYRIVQQCRRN